MWYLCDKQRTSTLHLKVWFSKKKEHETPPIWGHSEPIQASSRTYWKIKKPAFLEGRWYTGRKIRQIWAELAVHVGYHLQKGWFFYFLICTRWSLNGSQMIPDRWRFMFFFFCWSTPSNDVWGVKLRNIKVNFNTWGTWCRVGSGNEQ